MSEPTHEPFGTYWYDSPIAVRRSTEVCWDEFADILASADSATQANFLNNFVLRLDRNCGGPYRTQMQSLCIAQDRLILEQRTVEVLEDIVFFFKERGKPA